jgi:outer membrane protein assembly factor BamB
MKRALVIAALAACSADEPAPALTADYTLEAVSAIAAAHHVVGVDTDHAGGLWLAYQLQSAGYTFDDLRIVHLDPDGAVLREFDYPGADSMVSGLAFSGDAIWLSYGREVEDKNRLRKLDPQTGAELATLPSEPGIQDITVRGNLVLLSTTWRELVAIDATTGTQQWRTGIADLADSECRGIAASDAGTWVVSLIDSRALLIDDTGVTIESASFPYGTDDWSVEDGLHLALDGTTLVLHRRNQITWYAPADAAR